MTAWILILFKNYFFLYICWVVYFICLIFVDNFLINPDKASLLWLEGGCDHSRHICCPFYSLAILLNIVALTRKGCLYLAFTRWTTSKSIVLMMALLFRGDHNSFWILIDNCLMIILSKMASTDLYNLFLPIALLIWLANSAPYRVLGTALVPSTSNIS